MAVLDAPGLDALELGADLQGHVGPAGGLDHVVAVEQTADRGHDGGGAAREDLGDLARADALGPLGEGDATLLDGQAHVPAELEDRGAGDALEDRAGERRGDEAAVGVHEEHVHAAELLDRVVVVLVEEHDLVGALRRGLQLGQQRGGVVAAGLGRAHAALAGAGVVTRDPDGHRLELAAEVVAGRRGDHHVPHLPGRADAEERLGGEHEGAQVEGLARAGGHPGPVRLELGPQRAEEQLLGQLRQGQAAGGAVQAGRVGLGAERPHRPVLVPVGLQALEDLLAVVQHGGRGVQGQRAVGLHAGVMPRAAVLVPGPVDRDHVVREDVAETGVLEDLDALLIGHRGQMRLPREHGLGHGGITPRDG